MSYEEAMYFKQKSKQKALDQMEQKRMDIENSLRLMPKSNTSVASDNMTFGKGHYNSMADALKKVNPRKWK